MLTPHEGELARLLGRESKEIAAHRLAAVREAVERFGCVVAPQRARHARRRARRGLLVSALGLPSLATAGTGDVLTGIVARVPREGHGAAARRGRRGRAQQRASVEAPQRAGLVASDLIDALPRVLA